MIRLTATNATLEVESSLVSSLHCSVSIDRLTATDLFAESVFTSVTTAGTTTVVAAPVASEQKQVRALTIYNGGAAINTATVKVNVGGTAFRQRAATLRPGESLEYNASSGWSCLDASGRLRTTSVEEVGLNGEVNLPLATTPVAPAANTLNIFAAKMGGRMMAAQQGPSGLDTLLQPNLGGNKIALWMPPGGSTTVPGVFGMAALTATGTATSRVVATTNLLTRMTRLGYVSAATAAALTGAREAVLKYTTGAGGTLGGFWVRIRFAPSDAANVAGARMFVGLSASSGAPTNVEPNTLLNALGVVQLSTSANLHMYGAGAVAGTPVDLGSTFPANLNSVPYELTLFSPASGGCTWQVTRLDTGDVATGTFAAVPLGTVLLCTQLWRTNNATALAVGLDICGIYIETDY